MVISPDRVSVAIAFLSFALTSCGRLERPNPEAAEFSRVSSALETLSFDLKPILAIGTITNIEQLRLEYQLRYTDKPVLFTTRFAVPSVWIKPQELPAREYFWLTTWRSSDQPTTPLFWSYFHTPKDLVSYLTIEGSENTCLRSEFDSLLGPISNRVERASVEQVK